MNLPDLLHRHSASDAGACQPILFDAAREADRAGLIGLLGSGHVASVHDTLSNQLAELISLRAPGRTFTLDELANEVKLRLGGGPAEHYGTWAFFPWSRRLVHLLPKDEFREVRTDRNRYKITREEQQHLGHCRIGVLGLSVGNMAAVTLALEGVGGHFRIADFDRLSLSNLNRLRGGVHDLETPKTALAARAMFELDPWLEITLFADGLNADNIDQFLTDGGPLDLLIEECDDLYLKIAVRERARALRIPVLMDTSDKGLLDIERFDREPDRPLLHGLIGGVDALALRGLPTKDKVPLVLAILGGHRMSVRMAASLPEVKESISSWPQLASSVALGGALGADVARRILLGSLTTSGRFYVDLEQIVRDGAAELSEPAPLAPPHAPAREALQERSLPAPPEHPRADSSDTIRWLVSHAVLAPSAHNSQPWRFAWQAGALDLIHDPAHDLLSLDFEGRATDLTFGAVAETLEIAARSLGLATTFELFPEPKDPLLVARAKFEPRLLDRDPLVAEIARRVTNRRRGPRQLLSETERRLLVESVTPRGAQLLLLTKPEQLTEVGRLIGACDRLSHMNRDIHRDVFAGFRWNREQVLTHRDGLDITTLELSPTERAGTELLSSWPVVAALKGFGGGKALEDIAIKSIDSASAVALVVIPGLTRESYFRAGRAVQRLWLTATRLGIAVQPMTGLPYLFARLERAAGVGFDALEQRELWTLRQRYLELFAVPAGYAEAFLVRFSKGDAPTSRSLRRPLDGVLSIA